MRRRIDTVLTWIAIIGVGACSAGLLVLMSGGVP
jgi:hypothetical protein